MHRLPAQPVGVGGQNVPALSGMNHSAARRADRTVFRLRPPAAVAHWKGGLPPGNTGECCRKVASGGAARCSDGAWCRPPGAGTGSSLARQRPDSSRGARARAPPPIRRSISHVSAAWLKMLLKINQRLHERLNNRPGACSGVTILSCTQTATRQSFAEVIVQLLIIGCTNGCTMIQMPQRRNDILIHPSGTALSPHSGCRPCRREPAEDRLQYGLHAAPYLPVILSVERIGSGKTAVRARNFRRTADA